jgi:hypothetical protein
VSPQLGDNINKRVDHLGSFEVNVEFRSRKSLKDLHQRGETLPKPQINTREFSRGELGDQAWPPRDSGHISIVRDDNLAVFADVNIGF